MVDDAPEFINHDCLPRLPDIAAFDILSRDGRVTASPLLSLPHLQEPVGQQVSPNIFSEEKKKTVSKHVAPRNARSEDEGGQVRTETVSSSVT
jgi:hypothetical protein